MGLKKEPRKENRLQTCACSRVAVKKGNGGWVCQRCADIEGRTYNIGGDLAVDPNRKYTTTYGVSPVFPGGI